MDSLFAGDFVAFADALRHLILPAFALSLATLAQVARLTRSRMLEELLEGLHSGELAQGLPALLITYKYMLRNALTATLTVIGLAYGFLLGNAFLVEAVYRLARARQLRRDGDPQQRLPGHRWGDPRDGNDLCVLINTIVDLLYACVDPRIRYAR